LDGSEKMSKRNPNSYFTFNEPLDSIEKKVRSAYTGGRKNMEMQKELGGEPQKCMIYKILTYFFEDDDQKLAEEFEQCIRGELMCGEHKRACAEKVIEYVKEHRKEKEKKIDTAREILNVD
jgi:tryptophanyl-tRNA synthetase